MPEITLKINASCSLSKSHDVSPMGVIINKPKTNDSENNVIILSTILLDFLWTSSLGVIISDDHCKVE